MIPAQNRTGQDRTGQTTEPQRPQRDRRRLSRAGGQGRRPPWSNGRGGCGASFVAVVCGAGCSGAGWLGGWRATGEQGAGHAAGSRAAVAKEAVRVARRHGWLCLAVQQWVQWVQRARCLQRRLQSAATRCRRCAEQPLRRRRGARRQGRP